MENKPKKSDKEILSEIINSPITKTVVITGGSILLIIGLGLLFKVLAQTIGNYKDFRDSCDR